MWYCALFFLVFSVTMTAQPSDILLAGNLTGLQIARDPTGDLIVAGTAGVQIGEASFAPFYPPCSGGGDCGAIPTRFTDIYVAKLSPDGSRKQWDRIIGGSGFDFLRKVLVGPAGEIYLVVDTSSSDFPITAGTRFAGGSALLRLTAGGATDFSLFPVEREGAGIADLLLESSGGLLFTGTIGQTVNSVRFTGRMSMPGRTVQLSRFALGGTFLSRDRQGNVIIRGTAIGPEGAIETTPGAFQPHATLAFCGSASIGFPCPQQFIAKFAPDLQSLIFSTYLSGNSYTVPTGPAIELEDGSLFLAGTTRSTDYPTTADAFIRNYPSGVPFRFRSREDWASFATILSEDGARLEYSTYIGGAGTTQLTSASLRNQSTVVLRGLATTAFAGMPGRAQGCAPQDGRVTHYSFSEGFTYASFEADFNVESRRIARGAVRPDLSFDNQIVPTIETGDTLIAAPVLQTWTQASTEGELAARPDPQLTRSYAVLRQVPSHADAKPKLTCIEDTASLQSFAGEIAPGQLLTLFGDNLPIAQPAPFDSSQENLPTQLSGAELRIDGTAVPLLYASSSQINFVAPSTLTPGSKLSMELWVNGEQTASQQVSVVARKPSVFVRPGGTPGSCRYPEAAVVFAGGEPVTCENRAAAGDVVSFFFNGLGTGDQPDSLINQRTDIPPPGDLGVFFESGSWEVLYFGPAMGQPAGVWQANLRVPAKTTFGLRNVLFSFNQEMSPWLRGELWLSDPR